MLYTIERVEGACALARTTIWNELGPGLPPGEAKGERCFGSAVLGGAWFPPKALATLTAGQVLDEDPVLGFRTTFAGTRENLAVVLEQGPLEATRLVYDRTSGALVAIESARQNPLGGAQVHASLQLVR
jgi:hypothetical protein